MAQCPGAPLELVGFGAVGSVRTPSVAGWLQSLSLVLPCPLPPRPSRM